MNTVRELLVIIRIWGLLRPSCLPVFHRNTDTLDGLGLLFRLLSKLVQPNGDTQQQQQQVDDVLIGMFTNFLRIHFTLLNNMIFIFYNVRRFAPVSMKNNFKKVDIVTF